MTARFIYSDLEHGNFLNTDISRGSVVTQLRCGGIVNEDFVENLLVNLQRKNFENQSTFGKVMGNIIVACFLLTHSVVVVISFAVLDLMLGLIYRYDEQYQVFMLSSLLPEDSR